MADTLLIILSNGFFFYLTYGYYRLFWKRYPTRRLLYLFIWILLFTALNFAYYIFFNENGIWEMVAMISITFILTFAVILQQILERIFLVKEQIETYIANQRVAYYEKQYQEIARCEEETRRQRHELKNSYLAIYSMAEQGDEKRILEFVEKELKQLGKVSSLVVRTGNFTVDAVLNYKLDLARNMEVQLDLDLNIPTQLEVNHVMLCGVLGNALDNALDACSRLPKEKRYIRIHMNVEKKNLFLEIVNSYDGIIKTDSSGRLTTRKNSMRHHGFGLEVMKHLLEDYNGNLDIDWDKEQFQIRAIIYHVL